MRAEAEAETFGAGCHGGHSRPEVQVEVVISLMPVVLVCGNCEAAVVSVAKNRRT
jgi:hypothetical protein